MVIDSKKYNGVCSCGRMHKMETEFCVIENGCLKNLFKYMSDYNIGGYCVAVYDENTYKATEGSHPAVDAQIILPSDNLHANEHGVQLLQEKLPEQTEVLIAIGSGTIHDITRYCAYENKVDFVSCPTAASVDGFCSSVAAMTWNGCKKTLTAVSPRIVVADIDIIKNAPINLAKSGFGDMIGKYIALTDWKLSNILIGEYYCETIAKMTLEATNTALGSLEGIISGDDNAYESLVYGLLLSGLAMQMIGNSRPASGAEHHISHLIEMQPKFIDVPSEALHGEKVGVGTLIVMGLYQQLIKLTNPEFTDYKGESLDVIESVFGKERLSDIENENKNDAATGVTGEMIADKWQLIVKELSELPKASVLTEIFEKYGVKSKLSDIGVSDDKEELIVKYAPLVRNRLTLLRLINSCFA